MRHLYRPLAHEELSVRGRYEWRTAEGALWATEAWERYRLEGTTGEAWRAEWKAAEVALLAHCLVSEGALERVQLRWLPTAGTGQRMTLTPEAGVMQVRDGERWEEVALSPGSGVALPLASLARFAFPFDLGSNETRQATLFQAQRGVIALTPGVTEASYTPLGLREFEVKGKPLRGKGWRISGAEGSVTEAWFDRSGTCLAWERAEGEARLVEWLRFG